MTKIQFFITTLIITFLVLGGVTVALVLKQKQADQTNSVNGSTVNTLGATRDTNGLSVAGGDMGQLNVGTSLDTPASSASTTDSADQFAQYDEYKDAPSALYADIQKGTGKAIEAGSKVAIYYKGWLTDGTLFDQSRKAEDGSTQPFMFTVGAQEVVPGMEQAIFGMKAGGTRRLIIPPKVGYGEEGQKDIIPPNAVLIFDVQLLAVQ